MINEVKDVLRICFLLLDINDLFAGHNPTFNKEVFEEWYKQILKWVHFQAPADMYSEIRRLECELAIKLAAQMVPLASEILEVIRHHERDPFGHYKSFEATHQSITEMLEKAVVAEIIERFKRVDGIEELTKGPRTYRSEKALLFHEDPIMHNAAVYAQLKNIAVEAQQNSVIQNNFYEFVSTLFYAATKHLDWTEKDKVLVLLSKREFIDIVWPAALARPMNLRTVGSLEEKRKQIVKTVLKDDNALPVPTWYKQLLEEAEKRA